MQLPPLAPKPRPLAYRVVMMPKTFWFFRRYLLAVGDRNPNRAAWFYARLLTFGRVKKTDDAPPSGPAA